MSTTNSAADWDRRYSASEQVWSLGPNQFVERELADLAAGNAVDLAGGEGRNAIWLAKRGWRVENIDISRVAIERFLARAESEGLATNTVGTVADARSARFSAKPDLVVINYLQLEIRDLAKALSNAAAQLAPGGMLFGVWHSRRNLVEGYGGPQLPELNPEPSQLQVWARESGLECEVREISREVRVGESVKTAWDVQIKAKRPTKSQ